MTKIDDKALDDMIEALKDMGLKKAAAMVVAIREEAPKAEGRECDCETFHSMDGLGYLCKRLPTVNGFKCVQYRCTISEGGDDDEEK